MLSPRQNIELLSGIWFRHARESWSPSHPPCASPLGSAARGAALMERAPCNVPVLENFKFLLLPSWIPLISIAGSRVRHNNAQTTQSLLHADKHLQQRVANVLWGWEPSALCHPRQQLCQSSTRSRGSCREPRTERNDAGDNLVINNVQSPPSSAQTACQRQRHPRALFGGRTKCRGFHLTSKRQLILKSLGNIAGAVPLTGTGC